MKKIALVVFSIVPLQLASASAQRVPDNLQVPAGNHAFLDGHAAGTQNYMCLPSGSLFAWTAIGPQATLFRDNGRQIITHFLSTNPAENLARATWQHSRDTSRAWAQAIASSADPGFVAAGAIPWLLLQVVGTEEGPTSGDILAKTTFIQRVNTIGGIAPSTGCGTAADVGKRAFVPYEARYVFYAASVVFAPAFPIF